MAIVRSIRALGHNNTLARTPARPRHRQRSRTQVGISVGVCSGSNLRIRAIHIRNNRRRDSKCTPTMRDGGRTAFGEGKTRGSLKIVRRSRTHPRARSRGAGIRADTIAASGRVHCVPTRVCVSIYESEYADAFHVSRRFGDARVNSAAAGPAAYGVGVGASL